MVDGSALIIESHGRILLQQRDFKDNIPFPGYWCLPGGHKEKIESPIETLVREIHEELNFNIEDLDIDYIGMFSRLIGDGRLEIGNIFIYKHTGDYTINNFKLNEGRALVFANPSYLDVLHVTPDMKRILGQMYRK